MSGGVLDTPPDRLAAHPLEVMDIEAAAELQHRWVKVVSDVFPAGASLSRGDLGVREPGGRPATTVAAEEALAAFFDADAAVLVRGSGTGALRSACFAAFEAGDRVLVHGAPMYETTAVTFRAMGLRQQVVDYNDLTDTAVGPIPRGALVGHARQLLSDRYEPAGVIRHLKQLLGDRPVVVDDNYAVTKTPRVGVQLGADLTTFSAFKVGGPQGVGVVCGRRDLIDQIRADNRSGGCQVQGHEAMDVLRGLVESPVLAALRSRVTAEVAASLEASAVPGIVSAVATNNAESIVLARLAEPHAAAVILAAARAGASPYPVGAESRYELAPLVYRPSKAMLADHPDWIDWLLRINPNRAGTEHVIDLLRSAVATTNNGGR